MGAAARHRFHRWRYRCAGRRCHPGRRHRDPGRDDPELRRADQGRDPGRRHSFTGGRDPRSATGIAGRYRAGCRCTRWFGQCPVRRRHVAQSEPDPDRRFATRRRESIDRRRVIANLYLAQGRAVAERRRRRQCAGQYPETQWQPGSGKRLADPVRDRRETARGC